MVSGAQDVSAGQANSLQRVLDWWAAPGNAPGELSSLQEEIQRIRNSKKRRAAVAASAAKLIQADEPSNLSDSTALEQRGFPAPLQKLLWDYAISSEIAGRSKKTEDRYCWRLLLTVIALGTVFWLLRYANQFWPEPPQWYGYSLVNTGGYAIAVLLFIASVVQRKQFRRYRERFLIARTMEETLRVDLFQRIAGTGLDTLGLFRRHHQLSDQAPFTIRVLETALAGTAVSGPTQPGGIELARKLWLESELRFFGDPEQIPPSDACATGLELRRHRVAETCLRVSLFLALALLILSLASKIPLPQQFTEIAGIVGMATELGAGLFGLLTGFFHQVAALHAVTGQKYRRAGLYLADVLSRMDRTSDDAARRELLRQAAWEALAETADWGVHQREHTPRTAFR